MTVYTRHACQSSHGTSQHATIQNDIKRTHTPPRRDHEANLQALRLLPTCRHGTHGCSYLKPPDGRQQEMGDALVSIRRPSQHAAKQSAKHIVIMSQTATTPRDRRWQSHLTKGTKTQRDQTRPPQRNASYRHATRRSISTAHSPLTSKRHRTMTMMPCRPSTSRYRSPTIYHCSPTV